MTERLQVEVTGACVGSGDCVETCPSVFVLGDDGFAEVREEVDLISHHEGIEEAADACPTAAIEVDG